MEHFEEEDRYQEDKDMSRGQSVGEQTIEEQESVEREAALGKKGKRRWEKRRHAVEGGVVRTWRKRRC